MVFPLHICMWNVWFCQKIIYKYLLLNSVEINRIKIELSSHQKSGVSMNRFIIKFGGNKPKTRYIKKSGGTDLLDIWKTKFSNLVKLADLKHYYLNGAAAHYPVTRYPVQPLPWNRFSISNTFRSFRRSTFHLVWWSWIAETKCQYLALCYGHFYFFKIQLCYFSVLSVQFAVLSCNSWALFLVFVHPLVQ